MSLAAHAFMIKFGMKKGGSNLVDAGAVVACAVVPHWPKHAQEDGRSAFLPALSLSTMQPIHRSPWRNYHHYYEGRKLTLYATTIIVSCDTHTRRKASNNWIDLLSSPQIFCGPNPSFSHFRYTERLELRTEYLHISLKLQIMTATCISSEEL